MKKLSKKNTLDVNVKPVVFDVMADLLERGVIKESDIKKSIYKSEYKRVKKVK